MNQRLVTVLVFALVVAGIASLVVYRGISAHLQANAPGPTTRLLVAARDLEVGSLVGDADVREMDWPGAAPARVVTKRQDAVGRGVVTKIFQDEPFIAERLAAQGAGAGLAATIPVGMRAVALRVNDVIGLAGFVMPGMHVDVIVSGSPPQAAQAGTVSRTVLQDIEVLSAGQKIARTADGKPEDAQVVNLLVTPDQAEVLSLASNEEKVQLVLRNPMDTRNESTHGVSVAGLFGGVSGMPAGFSSRTAGAEAAQPRETARPVKRAAVGNSAPKPPAEPPPVEVFSGSKRAGMSGGTGSN